MRLKPVFLMGFVALGLGATDRPALPDSLSPQIEPPQTNTTQTLLLELGRMNPRIAEVRRLISQGADINARSDDGFPALHLAIWKNWKITRLLVDMGANLNAQNRNGDTAVAVATEMGEIQTVALLFNEGADPNIRNFNGRSALGKARYMMSRPTETASQRKRHSIIANLLKSLGAKE